MADGFGAEFKYDPHVHPRVDCSHLPCRVRMTPHEIVNLDMADPEVAEAWREEFLPENLETADTSYLYTCGAGIYNFVVDPYGALEMCLVSRHGEYHLREGGFAEGFRDYFSELRERKRERPSRCVSCDLFSVCRTCPGTSLLETGDREEPVDYLCELTRLRAATFGGLVQIESAG
jgi:radical SAM protein with 4Fe4S-binding SPASM domain